MQEKIISTEHIYDGKIVKLDVHQVELPDGRESARELVNHPGAVAMVALDNEQNVLLVRQYRIGAGKVLLEVPAGTLSPDEAPIVCAERELQEETGYKPGTLEPMGGFFVAPGYSTEYIHLYLATDLKESLLPHDDDEFIELERIPLVDTPQLIESGEICDSKTVASLLRVARKMGV